MPIEAIRKFLQLESAGGILLMIAAVLALIMANTPASGVYNNFVSVPIAIQIGAFEIAKPTLLWINDGLMAVFFLLVGLEVKREFVEGELGDLRKAALPGIAALGGMVVPVGVYLLFNWHDPVARQGWAIPAATDIAFALGVLTLFGRRVPMPLKIFLMSLAIFDDLAAIVIIAIFYTSDLSLLSLSLGLACLAVLIVMNRKGVTRLAPYIVVGLLMWVCVLKSGVHATLAGVALAFAIPATGRNGNPSPMHTVEEGLHPWVAYAILPLFAFANAGVTLGQGGIDMLFGSVPLGIASGLFIGKQVGVFVFSLLAVKLGIAARPASMSWKQLYGVSLLCGVGFTMSLFIGTLAFEHGGGDIAADRLGILAGSILSAVAGYLVLKFTLPKEPVA